MTRFVTRYEVTGVSRTWTADGSHTHISGLYTQDGYYPSDQVLRSIELRNHWVAASPHGAIRLDVSTCRQRHDCRAVVIVGVLPDGHAATLDHLVTS